MPTPLEQAKNEARQDSNTISARIVVGTIPRVGSAARKGITWYERHVQNQIDERLTEAVLVDCDTIERFKRLRPGFDQSQSMLQILSARLSDRDIPANDRHFY